MDKLENLDEFESIFRRSEVPRYGPQSWEPRSALVVCDTLLGENQSLPDQIQGLFPGLSGVDQWEFLELNLQSTVEQVEKAYLDAPCDVLITWRHLCEESYHPHHSLGVFVDVITQVIPVPVLLLPGPTSEFGSSSQKTLKNALVATDHLPLEGKLVDYAVAMFGQQESRLVLAHVEDDLVYQRYLHAISKIPEVSTKVLEEKLMQQLLHDADRFAEHTAEVLAEKSSHIQVVPEIRSGHRLKAIQELVGKYDVDLLVMNTKDDDQLAMHGLAYSLSVELHQVAQLLL